MAEVKPLPVSPSPEGRGDSEILFSLCFHCSVSAGIPRAIKTLLLLVGGAGPEGLRGSFSGYMLGYQKNRWSNQTGWFEPLPLSPSPEGRGDSKDEALAGIWPVWWRKRYVTEPEALLLLVGGAGPEGLRG